MDVSSDGRLLACVCNNGVRLWDLATVTDVAFLPVRACSFAAFHPDGRSLFTCGTAGIQRWPIVSANGEKIGLCIGPPQEIGVSADSLVGAFLSPDGRSLGVIFYPGEAHIFDIQEPGRILLLSGQPALYYLSFSPAGHWIATSTWHGSGVKVWDGRTGKLLRDLPVSGTAYVAFSPNGEWLVTSTGQEYRSWQVGSWEPGPLYIPREGAGNMPGNIVFTGDGKMMAIAFSRTLVRLVDPSTGQEFATLPTVAGPCCFTPDGHYLVTGGGGNAIQVWDLHRIRAQLATLELDWAMSPYPPAERSVPAQPIQGKVDLGHSLDFLSGGDSTSIALNSLLLVLNPFNFEAYLRRGRAYGRQDDGPKAIADYSLALALMPPGHMSQGEALFRRSNNYRRVRELSKAQADLQKIAELDLRLPVELHHLVGEQCNALARLYVAGSESERDAKKALPLAKKAVALRPAQWMYINTLGVVQYRLGQYVEAEETLQRSLRESHDEGAGFNLFFLAMCHARRGDAAEARNYHDRAVAWVREQQDKRQAGWKEQLDAFRVEAEDVLKQTAKPR
jgi:tetratricopeptide (TPR) repeat protein